MRGMGFFGNVLFAGTVSLFFFSFSARDFSGWDELYSYSLGAFILRRLEDLGVTRELL